MHNRFWLSVLLALFLTTSGCAKHDDSSSTDSSAADSIAPAEKRAEPAPQPAAPVATGAVQDKPAQEPAVLMESNSAAPEKADERSRSEMAKPEAVNPEPAKPKAQRKKEAGTAEDKASPSGDDMERMD